MIQTLDDAWKWYEAVNRLAERMRRIAKYWHRPELSDILGRDNKFREVSAASIQDDANRVLEDLKDLAVLILFTVFKAEVREVAEIDAVRLIESMTHPAMVGAAGDLKEAIRSGGFGKVTSAYRSMDVDLTAQIDQIRGFRNWVAHGRRDEPKNMTDPERASRLMRAYFEKIRRLGTEPEKAESEATDL